MNDRYRCKAFPLDDINAEGKMELLLNEMAEKGYHFVNSVPIDVGNSGRIYRVNLIFEKDTV